MLTTRSNQANVKAHVRVSKNGKVHTVRAHQRATTLGEHFTNAYNTAFPIGQRRKAAYAAAGIIGSTIAIYALQGIISVVASILITLILVAISAIALAFKGRTAKPGKWFPRFFPGLRGPLSPRRRVKHWYKKKGIVIKRKIVPAWLHK